MAILEILKEDLLYEELVEAVEEIRPYYDVDKIKMYSVYIWTKGNKDADTNTEEHWGKNVFDIEEDEIVFYVKDHKIPEEVMPIIQNIQSKIKAIRLNGGK